MIEVLRADITSLSVDAIVNAANEAFRGGGGVDGAIHRAAGPELLRECERHASLPTGQAILTRGYKLPSRYVIHTVGPIWGGGLKGEPALLQSAYRSVFRVARHAGDIRSLAFPSISTGIYGYPKHEAAKIAASAMHEFESHFDRIVACVFSDADAAIYREAMSALMP